MRYVIRFASARLINRRQRTRSEHSAIGVFIGFLRVTPCNGRNTIVLLIPFDKLSAFNRVHYD